jgi:hypothetical protein
MSQINDPTSTPSSTESTQKFNAQAKRIDGLKDQVKSLEEEIFSLKTEAAKLKTVPADSRQAVYAQLHQEVFLPSLGQLPKSMDCSPSSQQPKLRGLTMFATPYGLEVDLRGRTGFIPWGNVAWCVFKTVSKDEAKKLDANAHANSAAPGYSGPTKLGTATVTAK